MLIICFFVIIFNSRCYENKELSFLKQDWKGKSMEIKDIKTISEKLYKDIEANEYITIESLDKLVEQYKQIIDDLCL